MNLEVNHFDELQDLFSQGMKLDEIRNHLQQKGYQSDLIDAGIHYIKQLKYRKQRQTGFTLLAFGAMLCLASCLLTFLHGYSAMYSAFVLYGLTMLGAGLVLAGLALILGI